MLHEAAYTSGIKQPYLAMETWTEPPALNTKICFFPLKCEKYQNIRVIFPKI